MQSTISITDCPAGHELDLDHVKFMNKDSTASSAGAPSPQKIQITPELVRAVADKVYAQMRRDIKLGRERSPRSVASLTNRRRGW